MKGGCMETTLVSPEPKSQRKSTYRLRSRPGERHPPESASVAARVYPARALPPGMRESVAGLAVCGLLVFVAVGRIQELWAPLTSLRLGLTAILLAGLVSLGQDFSILRARLDTTKGKVVLGLFILSCLSVPFGVWPGYSLDFIGDKSVLILIFFCVLLLHARTLSGVMVLAWTMAVSALALALAGLSGLAAGRRLAASSTYDPNDMAFVMLCGLPFVFLLTKRLRGLGRWLALGAAVVVILAIAATGSRGGAIGLAVLGGFILLADRTLTVGKRVVVITACALIFWFLAPPSAQNRFLTMFTPEEDYNITASSGRMETWKRGVKIMFMHPLLGVGVSGFETANGIYFGGEGSRWKAAHNSLIEVGAELGLPGLTMFVFLLWSSLRSMLRLGRSDILPPGHPGRDLAMAVAASLVGYVSAGFFLSQGYSSVVYLLVAMTILLEDISRSMNHSPVARG